MPHETGLMAITRDLEKAKSARGAPPPALLLAFLVILFWRASLSTAKVRAVCAWIGQGHVLHEEGDKEEEGEVMIRMGRHHAKAGTTDQA